MEAGAPGRRGSQRSALSERPDGRGMGAGRAADPTGQARWASASGKPARGAKRSFLRALDGMPMGRCRRICRPRARRTSISRCGTGTARCSASTRRSMPRCASERGERRARARRCSTAKAPSRRKKGAQDPQGYDAGKKITGRKQHILVDTLGLLLSVDVLPADVQDRDGIGTLLRRARKRFPFTGRIFADAGYQGPKVASVVAALGNWIFEIVKRMHITSTSCRGAGWSNEPSPGSAEIDGLPAISSATPALSPPSAASP